MPDEQTEIIKAGARHSATDMRALQDIHDAAITLGANCPQTEPPKEVTEFPLTNTLKAISETPDEMRVANYLVLFGGRDLEGIGTPNLNEDGSHGEYFTSKTVLDSSATKAGVVPVDWEHGKDPDSIGIGKEALGYVDWKSMQIDDKGVYVERVLNRRKSYMHWIETLVKAGLIGTSSQADPTGIEKSTNGEILKWPVIADALTVSPVEPRMMTENTLQAAKALGVVLKQQSAEPQVEVEGAGNAPPGEGTASTSNQSIQQSEIKSMELTQEQLDALLASAGKAGADAALKSLPSINAAGVQVIHDEADTPFKTMGEQLGAVKQATLTQGRELAPRLKALNLKALGSNELIGSEGGFLLEPSFAAEILTPLHDSGPFSSRVTSIPTAANSNGITVRAVDESDRATGSRWGGIVGYRLAEAGTKLPSYPSFRLTELRFKKYAVLCYATDELLQDTTALAGIIQTGCGEELDFMVNDDIANGLGAAGPLGILVSPALVTVSKESGQRADTLMTENIFKMWARMHPRSKSNAVWYINTDVTPQLYAMNLSVGTGGMPMYMTPGSLPNSPQGSLLGRPVVETEFNASLGDKGDVLLADMGQYAFINRDVQTASSIHVQFLTDQTVYRFVYRCDGQPKIAKPLTPYKGTGNTLSPFVTLAERA